jgi:S1-C subfamily serine protease
MSGSFPELNADYYTWTVTHSTLASNLHNLGYAISTPTHPGSNGGVVINSKGEVLGIRYTPNARSLEGLSHILHIDQAATLLNEVVERLSELRVEPRLG